jgi:hypothetical protein
VWGVWRVDPQGVSGDSGMSRDLSLPFSPTRAGAPKEAYPRDPADRQCVESFNATGTMECLGRHWVFLDLDDAREKIEEWPTGYNEVRPHSAIGDKTSVTTIVPASTSWHRDRASSTSSNIRRANSRRSPQPSTGDAKRLFALVKRFTGTTAQTPTLSLIGPPPAQEQPSARTPDCRKERSPRAQGARGIPKRG